MTVKLSFQLLPGHAYGSQQATLLVRMDAPQDKVPDIEALEAVGALLADQFDRPDIAAGLPASGPEAVLERLLRWHLVVQQEQKIPVFGHGHRLRMVSAAPVSQPQIVMAVPCAHPEASRLAWEWTGMAIAFGAQPAKQAAVLAALRNCQVLLQAYALPGINSMHFLRAAFEMGVPTRRLSGDLFGYGMANRMRLLKSSITDETSQIGTGLAHRKQLTAAVLRQHGIPVPRHQSVRTWDEALKAAEKLGFPVVVKPDDLEQGNGVFAGLKDAQALEQAFQQTSTVSKNILVEKHHEGQDYRLTVFRGEVIKVLLRRPAAVVGDGQRTVAELVASEQNSARHRRAYRQSGRMSLRLDAEALGLLAERGLTAGSVPAAGEAVILRRKSNISAGGIQTLVPLDQVHPDNRDLAVRACEAVRLDLCGVDLLMPDITRSWLDSDAVIIELNAQPQIGIALGPEAYARILTRLGDGQWTIPLQLVICAAVAQLPSPPELVALCGAATGLASAKGVWIEGQRMVSEQPVNGFEAARILLLQRSVTSAVCCMTLDEIRHNGLPAPWFDRIVMLQDRQHDSVQVLRWGDVRTMVQAHTGALETHPARQAPGSTTVGGEG